MNSSADGFRRISFSRFTEDECFSFRAGIVGRWLHLYELNAAAGKAADRRWKVRRTFAFRTPSTRRPVPVSQMTKKTPKKV